MIFYDKRKEQYEVLYLKDSHFDVLQIIYEKKKALLKCPFLYLSWFNLCAIYWFHVEMEICLYKKFALNVTYSYYTVKHWSF